MELPEILIKQITKDYTKIHIGSIIGIIQYGSRVYGTADENSDWDFVVIHTDSTKVDIELYSSDDLDIHYLYIDAYKHLLRHHDIMAMETYYTMKQKHAIKEFDIEFELDLPTLRKSISSVSSNSFVKFKKKLTLENEDKYIGIKSLFHAIRIVDLGINIAAGSKKVMKTDTYLWERIKKDAVSSNYDWETLHKIYKPLLNSSMSEFRLLAPKQKLEQL